MSFFQEPRKEERNEFVWRALHFLDVSYLVLGAILLLGLLFHLYFVLPNVKIFSDVERDLSVFKELAESLYTFQFHTLPLEGSPAMFERADGSEIKLGFHGAAYYYLLIIPLFLSNFHIWGIALPLIALNILSIYIIFFLAKEFFDKTTAYMSAFLVTFSYNFLYNASRPWNPGFVLPFMLISLFSLLMIYKGKKFFWLPFAFSVAILSQLHIIGYFLLAFFIIGLFVLHPLFPRGLLLITTMICFIIPMAPTMLSELHSGFAMSTSVLQFTIQNFFSFGSLAEQKIVFYNQTPPENSAYQNFLLYGMFPRIFVHELPQWVSWKFTMIVRAVQDMLLPLNVSSFFASIGSLRYYLVLFFMIILFLQVFSLFWWLGRTPPIKGAFSSRTYFASLKLYFLRNQKMIPLLWGCALAGIVFLIGYGSSREELRYFSFGLPLVIIMFSWFITRLLSSYRSFPLGFLILLTYLYFNIASFHLFSIG